jgi:hypothetical protein
LPSQAERKRPELKHLGGGEETSAEITMRGIKVFEQGNMPSSAQYQIENKLQRKARILGLENARN